MSKFSSLATLVTVSFILVGCGDPVQDYVNAKFPPVTADAQQQTALKTAVATLHELDSPNLAFGAPLVQLSDFVLSQVAAQGIKDIRLSGDGQLLKAEIDFDRVFDAATDTPQGKLIHELKPNISGTLVIFAGLTSSVSNVADSTGVLDLKILPAFRRLHVEKLTIRGTYDTSKLGDAVVSILNRYADNVTGILSNLSVMQIKVPVTFAAAKNPSQLVSIRGTAFQGAVNIMGHPIAAPVRLRGVAWLVANNRITGLAELISVSGGVQAGAGPTVQGTNDALSAAFAKALSDGFAIKQIPDTVWAAVRKDIVAFSINAAFRQAGFCANAIGLIPRQEFSQQIKFPDETSVDCTPTRDCTPKRNCDVAKSHDDRNCSACIVRKPWGGCAIRGNDPFCEGQKAARNKIYDADYSARKLDCERLKSQEKLQCESEKAGQKALCETGKEALKRLARTGKFANIDGSFQGNASLRVCVTEVAVASDLSSIHATLDLAGNASGSLHVKFVPLDIVGNLACQVPWTEDQHVAAMIPQDTVSVNSNIKLEAGSDGPKFVFKTEPTSVKLKLRSRRGVGWK